MCSLCIQCTASENLALTQNGSHASQVIFICSHGLSIERVDCEVKVCKWSVCAARISDSYSKSPTIVDLTITNNFPMIHCSWRTGWAAEFPEFPDQEAEGRVLLAGSQTGRADRKQPVSILSFGPFPLCLNVHLLTFYTQHFISKRTSAMLYILLVCVYFPNVLTTNLDTSAIPINFKQQSIDF